MAWFDLKAPCKNCPFRRSMAGNYRLPKARLHQIIYGTAFECHKTTGVDGPKREPQQCAGLMALLADNQTPNLIMEAAIRLTDQTFDHIDRSDTFTAVHEAIAAHNPKDS